MIEHELTVEVITLEAWLSRASKVKSATRELVKLWLLNDLGCQRDLADHLGLTDRAIRKHVAKLRELGELPQVEDTDGRSTRNRQAAATPNRNLVPNSVIKPTAVSLKDFRQTDEAANEAATDADELARLRAEIEQLKEENADLRQQLQGTAIAEADNHVKEGVVLQSRGEEWLKSLSPEEELEKRTFLWYMTRNMDVNSTSPFVEKLMEEVQAAGAKYDDPGSMDRDRWEKIYQFVNPFFDEVDQLAELEEALGLASDDNEEEAG